MTPKERILAHRDKFNEDEQTYLESLTDDQARVIVSYWDSPIYTPHIIGKNGYERTFQFLGINQTDPIVQTLFGTGLK